MSRNKYILFALLLSLSAGAFAQKAERDYIRKGNRLFKDSVFVDAEVNYRKALEANPKSTISMYNLGNTLSQQQKFKDATSIEKDKAKLGQIYHNMGVLFQSGKDYQKAVEAYKMSLRNNPKDDETRYNLALAQKLLKDQQQNQQNQDQNQDQNKDDQQKQQDKKDQNKQNDQNKDQQQQQPPKSEKNDNEMSKENAEQLLNSVMQDEKGVQDKVKKQQTLQGRRLEKDW